MSSAEHGPYRLLDRLPTSTTGVVSRALALDVGMEDSDLHELVRRGALVRIRRGSYVRSEFWLAAGPERQHLLRCRATLAATKPDAHLAQVSTLVLYGSDLLRPDLSTVHLARRLGAGRREGGCRHSDAELPVDQQSVVDGMRTCTAARALVDYARDAKVTLDQAVVALDSVLHQRLTTLDEVRLAADRVRAWSGSRQVMRAVDLADGRSESVGETRNRLCLGRGEAMPEELQFVIVTDIGVFRVDFAWPTWRVAGEFDGRSKFGRLLGPGQTAGDAAFAERQRELAIERAGWVVVRFCWDDLARPDLVQRRVLDAFARARRLGLAPIAS